MWEREKSSEPPLGVNDLHRFSTLLMGNHALEIQRDNMQVRRLSIAVSTCLGKCLVDLCYHPGATPSGQLSGQLKSLQTGIWTGHKIKRASFPMSSFAFFSLFFMLPKRMPCCGDVKVAGGLIH